MGILLCMFASPKNYYSGKFYLAQVLIQMSKAIKDVLTRSHEYRSMQKAPFSLSVCILADYS